MRILITGSTGFLGGSLGRFAASVGHQVIGIARRSQPDLDWPGEHFSADVAESDLTGIISQTRPDLVFHGAGTASVAGSFTAPLDDLRAATITFGNVLESIRRSPFRPLVIFPSSAAVYGNPSTLPVSETAPASPISPYGFHKLACEKIAEEYSSCFGLDTMVCRIFSVFGPAQRRLLVWDIYQQLITTEKHVELSGSGKETRDYLYVDDLLDGMLALADGCPRAERGNHYIFNLASGTETIVSDLAREMIKIAAPSKELHCLGRSGRGDPLRWCADMTKARRSFRDKQPRPLINSLETCISAWQVSAAGKRAVQT